MQSLPSAPLTVSPPAHGQLFIVDLGILGLQLRKQIQDHLVKTAEFRSDRIPHFPKLARQFYTEIIQSLVRFLNLSPTQALHRVMFIEPWPFFQELNEQINFHANDTWLPEMDVFASTLQPTIMAIYLFIRNCFDHRFDVGYIPVKVGLGYVVIRTVENEHRLVDTFHAR